MFGFGEEEEDETVQEFDYAAQEMIAQAPDLDTGLAAMRDLYSEYGFQDSKKGQELLESRSTELRQKFDTHTQYDFNETVENVPLPLGAIELDEEYDDEEQRNIALINKWEEENRKALEESTDPINIQNRSKYVQDVGKAATALRREIYGADNYIVDGDQLKYSPSWGSLAGDVALSAGQGLVGGIASLIGAESVNDWFEEGIDPGFQQNHPYLSAISSGAGTAVGAIGSAVAAGPIGAASYLGVSGAGAVREQVEESLESGGTAGEAVTAGAIEAASQTAQSLVGGKVFGKVAGQFVGRATPALGAKVFPKVTGSILGRTGLAATAEGVTEGAGQIASNIAQNIGQGTDTPLLEGVGVSTVAGAVVGGAASGIGEIAARRSPLIEALEESEGAPPPPKEGIRIPTQPVELTNPTSFIVNEDGSELVSQEGRIHIKKGDTAVEAHTDNFFVAPEIKAKLDSLPHTPDGAGIHLATRNGKLYAETVQPFLNEDLTLEPNGIGSTRVEIPTTDPVNGNYHVGVSHTNVEGGFRGFKYDIAPSPIKDVSTAGAAHISDLKSKESQYIQKLRSRLSPEMLEMSGLIETNIATGEAVAIPMLQYMQTERGANEAGFNAADEYITTNGPLKTLSYLDALTRASDQDAYIAERLVQHLESGILKSQSQRDYEATKQFAALLPEARHMRDKIGTTVGRALQVLGAKSPAIAAEADIIEIQTNLTVAAEAEISKELGRPVTLSKLSDEVNEATNIAAEVQKQVDSGDISPEKAERLKVAKTEEQKAKDALATAEKKLQEKLAQFPQETHERLRTLYKLQEKATPTSLVKVNDEILQIRSKLVPANKQAVDSLWTYWRKNALSSVETAIRNATTVSNLASTLASYGLGDIARKVKGSSPGVLTTWEYGKGIVDGFREKGIPESFEILSGRRGGRLQLSEGGKERQPVRPLRTTSIPRFLNPINPLLDVAEVMHRVLGATDSLIYHSAEGGQYRIAAAMLELQGKEVTPSAIDQVLFGDKEAIIKDVDSNVQALNSIGIDINSRERNLMVREALELRRSETLRAVAEKHGLENTFMNETHPTVLGMIARGITTATNKLNIPSTQVHPGKYILPFVSTAANIGDMWLAHTPLGLPRYFKMRELQGKLKAENTEKAAEAARKGKEFTPEIDTYELAAQEQLGRIILGTAAIGSLAALLASQDEDDPWIRFYGRPSPDERRIWQEQGIPPFSLKIGNTFLSKELLGPLTLAFAFADNVVKAFKSNDNPAWIVPNTVMLSMGAISELSFLPAVTDFFQLLEGGETFEKDSSPTRAARILNFTGQRASQLLQPLIPASGLLRNIYKWYDGDPQETYNNLRAKLANNIPWAKELAGAPDKLNRFGEPIRLDLTKRVPTGVLMGRVLEDPVSNWMQRTGYNITSQGPMIKLNKGERGVFQEFRKSAGDKYPDTLDEKESRKVLELSGPQIKDYLSSLMIDPRYSTFSEDRQQEIHRQVAKIRAAARQAVLLKAY